jgi:hypothetical protein
VKRRALHGLWKVTEFAQLHTRFVDGGGLNVLIDNLKSETHPEILINAVSAMALLCENTRFRCVIWRAVPSVTCPALMWHDVVWRIFCSYPACVVCSHVLVWRGEDVSSRYSCAHDCCSHALYEFVMLCLRTKMQLKFFLFLFAFNNRYPSARAGAIEILLLHAMQPFIRMQLIATEGLATLCQEPQCQDYACDPARKGEVLNRMLTLVVTLRDPRCQEHMFCALAHVTTQERHVRAVAEANLRLGDVFKKLSAALLTDERSDKVDRSAREHSLVHLACILANLGCIRDPVQGSACRALCDLARLHNSADLQVIDSARRNCAVPL